MKFKIRDLVEVVSNPENSDFVRKNLGFKACVTKILLDGRIYLDKYKSYEGYLFENELRLVGITNPNCSKIIIKK